MGRRMAPTHTSPNLNSSQKPSMLPTSQSNRTVTTAVITTSPAVHSTLHTPRPSRVLTGKDLLHEEHQTVERQQLDTRHNALRDEFLPNNAAVPLIPQQRNLASRRLSTIKNTKVSQELERYRAERKALARSAARSRTPRRRTPQRSARTLSAAAKPTIGALTF
jgi:hypothetical protein